VPDQALSLQDYAQSLRRWLADFLDEHPPGLVPFAREGDRVPPGSRTGLAPATLALKVALQTGLWRTWDKGTRTRCVHRVLSFQERAPGPLQGWFIDEPAEEHMDRTPLLARVLKRPWRDPTWLWRMGNLRQAWAALAGAGAADRVRMPACLADADWTRAWWRGVHRFTDPWARYAHLSAFAAVLVRARSAGGQPAVPYADPLPPTTWQAAFAAAEGAPPRVGVSGLMKLVTLADLLDRPVLEPERLIDIALRASASEAAHVCFLVNPLLVFDRAQRHADHRAREVADWRNAATQRLADLRMPDGGFATTVDGSIGRYTHLTVGTQQRQGDVHGAHMVGWALALLGRAEGQDLGLTEPPT